ncbi:EpsG family protein [Bacteroides faecichinchillae]|uniref:EpsG family protein n=1 Tax=Bacteroides faecichinchillae TaxID=871325 RepID=UPI00131F07B1|nr:EpsG family protein [Bacteroides faecichinchillae]
MALFLGFIALLYAPTHDLFRHNLLYYDYVGEATTGIVFRQDVLLYTLTAWFAKWNINFEIIRFLFVFLSYQMYFSLFYSIQRKNSYLNNNKKISFLLFLLLLFSIRFFVICCGLRQGLATAFAVFGVYKLLIENRKVGYVFLLLAPLTHLSLIIAFVGVLIIKYINISFKVGLFLAIVLYLLSMTLMNYLSSFLGGDVGKAVEVYTTGYWGADGEAAEQISLKGMIALYFNQLQMLPLLYFMYKVNENSKYFSFIVFSFIICAVTLPYFAVIDRMIMLFMGISVLFLIYNFNGSRLHLKVSKTALILVASFFFISLYAERYTIRLSREYKLLTPVPYILMNNYSEQWLWNNVNNWGK